MCKNPRSMFELDPETFFVLRLEPVKRTPPLKVVTSQIKTTVLPNTYTAQDVGINSNAEIYQFWNKTHFSNYSDTTLQFLEKNFSLFLNLFQYTKL